MFIFNIYTGLLDFAPIYNTQFASLCWSIIFSLAGYLIYHFNMFNKTTQRIWLLIIAIIQIYISVISVMSDYKTKEGVNVEQLRAHFIYVLAIYIFVIMMRISYCWKDYIILDRVIYAFSSTIFGIFIIETHSNLITYVNELAVKLAPSTGEYFIGYIQIIMQLSICFCIIHIIKKIPYVKKLI